MRRHPFLCFCAIAAGAAFAALGARAAEFDLSPLHAYRAEQPQHGVVRIHDTELTQHLVHLWEDEFLKFQPLIRYSEYTVPAWFSGLCAGTADLAVTGHDVWRSDLKAFESIYGYPPLEIMVATGGFDRRKGNTPGVIVLVHKDNPLTGLTMEQLDGIFGAERTGGWQETKWTTDAARGPEKNIRTWGQLGLTGEWAGHPIRFIGIDATLSGWSGLIQREVFHGGDKWNPAIEEMVRGGAEVPADVQLVAEVGRDRYAIGFSFMRIVEQNPNVKALAIARTGAGPFIPPTKETFHDRTYPLDNAIYIYVNRAPGQPLPARLREFLAYVLSREGQRAVMEDGMFLPLPEDALCRELAKLN